MILFRCKKSEVADFFGTRICCDSRNIDGRADIVIARWCAVGGNIFDIGGFKKFFSGIVGVCLWVYTD